VLGLGMNGVGATSPLSEFSKVIVEGAGVYIGYLDRQGQRAGLGTLVSEEEVYEGEWKASQKTGCGRISLPDGRTLVGEFRQGLLEGAGQVQTAEKLVQSVFLRGEADGVCSVQYLGGHRCILGRFQKDRLNGFGLISSKGRSEPYSLKSIFDFGVTNSLGEEVAGSKEYRGEFFANCKHGVGLYSDKAFELGRLEYLGYFEHNVFSKFGILKLGSGEVFEGGMRDGLKCGIGRTTSAKKKANYIGQFLDDVKHGFGQLQDKETGGSERTYIGHWSLDQRHGIGFEFHSDYIYQGEFAEDLPHGRAVVHNLRDDSKQCSIFSRGRLVKTVQGLPPTHFLKGLSDFDFESSLQIFQARVKQFEKFVEEQTRQVRERFASLNFKQLELEERSFRQDFDQFQLKLSAVLKKSDSLVKRLTYLTANLKKKFQHKASPSLGKSQAGAPLPASKSSLSLVDRSVSFDKSPAMEVVRIHQAMDDRFLEDYLQVMEQKPGTPSPPEKPKSGTRPASKLGKLAGEPAGTRPLTPTKKPEAQPSGTPVSPTPRPASTAAGTKDWKQDLATFSIGGGRVLASDERPEPELLDRLRNQRDTILKQPAPPSVQPRAKVSSDLPAAIPKPVGPSHLAKKYDYKRELEQLILDEYKAAFNTLDPPSDAPKNLRLNLDALVSMDKLNHSVPEFDPFLEDESSNPFFLPIQTGGQIFKAGLLLRSKRRQDTQESKHLSQDPRSSKHRDASDSREAKPQLPEPALNPASPISTGIFFESKSRKAPPKTASKTRAYLSRLDSSKESSLISRTPSPNQVYGRSEQKLGRAPQAATRESELRLPESKSAQASGGQHRPLDDLERWTAEISNIVIPDDHIYPVKQGDIYYNSRDLDKTVANDLTVLGLREALKSTKHKKRRTPRSPEEDLETTRERAVAMLSQTNISRQSDRERVGQP
jgi:hypothetical protein